MKTAFFGFRFLGILLAGLASLAVHPARGQNILTTSYTNTFDTAGAADPFSGDGSVASWIYWYGLGYSSTPMTNDPTMDAQGDPNSGSLMVYLPFGSSGDQGVFFGTVNNQYGYDGTETFDARNYTNLTFDIHFAPGTRPNAAGNLGSVTMSIFPNTWTNGGDFAFFPSVTIPASATNGWYHAVVSITNFLENAPLEQLTNCAGIAFDYNSYNGYPKTPVTFWLDNVAVVLGGSPPPPPPAPTLSIPQKALPGLNLIATSAGNQYDRYSIVTTNDTGYTFVGRSNVTYSWNITSFPGAASSGFQQHLFLIPASSINAVVSETAADYAEPNCIFITVQYESSVSSSPTTNAGVVSTNSLTNWFGVLNFRYKTNDANDNGMIFNTALPSNKAANPNGWPVEPVGSVQAPTATGKWSVSFSLTTNVTLTAPNGATNSFTIPAASAGLFADPLYVVLGAQPNNTAGEGLSVVLDGFSITGSQTPLSDQFTNDVNLSASKWLVDSADPSGVQLVPPGAGYWLGWSLPDTGFDLQTAPGLVGGTNTTWTLLTGPNAANPISEFLVLSQRTVLLTNQPAAGASQIFFELIQDQ